MDISISCRDTVDCCATRAATPNEQPNFLETLWPTFFLRITYVPPSTIVVKKLLTQRLPWPRNTCRRLRQVSEYARVKGPSVRRDSDSEILKIIHLLFQQRYLENETMYRGESKSVLRREVRTMWLACWFLKMLSKFGVLSAWSSDNFSRCYWELLRFGVIKLIMWAACPLCHQTSSIFYKCNFQKTFPIRVSQRAS